MSSFVGYRCDQTDVVVSDVPVEATRVSPRGHESHPAMTDKCAAERFIQASIALGFVTFEDVAAGRVEVTVEAREDSNDPWDVFVFLNKTECIFFEPVR